MEEPPRAKRSSPCVVSDAPVKVPIFKFILAGSVLLPIFSISNRVVEFF